MCAYLFIYLFILKEGCFLSSNTMSCLRNIFFPGLITFTEKYQFSLFCFWVPIGHMLFTVVAVQSYIEENGNVPCHQAWLKTVLVSFFSFLQTVTHILQDSCMLVPVHKQEVLCWGRRAAADAELLTALVLCLSRAAVMVLHHSVFPLKLPVAICTHSLLPKGFASNKIMYLTT